LGSAGSRRRFSNPCGSAYYVTGIELFVAGGLTQIWPASTPRVSMRSPRHMSGLLQSIGSAELLQCHGSRVRLAPVAHGVQQRPQRLSKRGNGVYHSRRRVGVNGTFNDSRGLQLAKLLGERSLCDSGNSALQFGEPLGALEKLLENRTFPASTDDTCGGFYRTNLWALSHANLVTYCIPCSVRVPRIRM